ncbi:FER1L6, partial [Symbiodinium sp. KB8]
EGGVKVVEEGVLGDEAADVDFSVFGAAEDGGGLAAVARSSRDTAAEAAASEAAVDGDLSWLYRHLKRADAAEGMPEEDKAVGYLSQRREYECGLEEALVTAPFETYDVRRGSALPRGSIFGFRLRSSNRRVGVFKGIIRIIRDPRKTPPPVALESLLRPEQYLVRVYVMDGRDFIPTDGNSGDPYLVLTLGDEKVSDRKRYIPKTLSPQFYRCLEIKANLPGPSRLHIAAWDYDYVTFDDFIGETIVDLEDRWFDKRWQSFGLAQQTDERLATRPVEDRTLFSPTFFGSCGQLRMWVDILRPGDAAKYPMIDITPPPPRKFQFRVVVWRARGVATNDKLTNMNDMYARVWLEGMRPMETDTHWRAKGGKASFNWRFLWDIELPYKFAYLNVQLWDRDILKWNDCIAEVQVDLSALFKRAQFQDSVYRIFDDARRHKNGGVDPDESSRQGSVTVRSDGKAPSVYGEDSAPVPQADDAAVSAMAAADKRWSKAAKLKSTAAALTSPRPAMAAPGGAIGPGDDDWDEGSAGDPHEAVDDEMAAKRRHERMVKAMEKARRKAEKKRRKQRAEARGRIKRSPTEDAENIALDLVTREERERLLQDRDPDRQQTELDTMAVTLADDEEKANEAKETISTVKSLMGFPQHPKAEHAKWLPCTCNYRNGKYFPTKRGELLVSAELVPEELVQAVPAGRGRSQPNMNPILPPPAGRLRFSLNPFYLGNAICGPRLFQQCLICFCLLIIILVFALGGPAIQVLVDMYNIIPWPANLIIFAIVFVCLCGPTVLLCVRSCIRQAVLAAIESRPDGPDDHSVLGDKDEERGIEKGGVQDAVGAEAGPGGNFGRSAAEPTSDPNKPDYGYAEDEEELMFLRDAAIISRQRGMKR